ncbi:MAG: DUF420 domain-containing protein [Acidobacteriota bacterium]
MFDLTVLPALNASINTVVSGLLIAGRILIGRGKREAHRRCMLAAVGLSVVFLISYLTYHYQVGATRFQGTGAVRTLYFAILISHTVLAASVPFLALITLVRALRQRFDEHRRIARWTFPIWLYVSITGVLVYLMLYQLPVQ